MGGDFGPPVTVPAAASALKRHPSLELVMVGDEEQLAAQCQRCLEWMSLELCIKVCALAMPSADDDFAYEQSLIAAPEGQLKLADLVEDEILLACPMIPVHGERSCDSPAGSGPQPDERYKPFAGLADLIKKQG